MRYHYLGLILSGLIFSNLINAQQTWSLNECIDYAHQNNLQIKRTELKAEIAENDYLKAKLNILPSVNASFSRSYYFGRHIDQGTNEILEDNSMGDSYGISSNVSLFAGLQNYNQIKLNNYNLLASLQNVEKEKVEITMSIATAYLEILFQKELLQITENQMGTTNLQVERTEKLVEAGSVAKGNLYEIQAQLANEKLNTINAQNSLKLARLNLVQILDLDSLAGFDIDFMDTIDNNNLPVLPNVLEVYSESREYLPHIKSAEYQLKSSETNLKIQKGGLSPTIYASGSLGTGYSTSQEDAYGQNYSEQFDINRNKYIGVGVNIPIFNRGRVKNNIDNAKIQVYDATYALEQTEQQLYKNIQQAHSDASSAQEKYSAALEAVNSYKEAFHYTEQKFNVGIVNSVDYTIAKNNLIKAESDLLQAKYSYIFSVKILDLYRGIPISL